MIGKKKNILQRLALASHLNCHRNPTGCRRPQAKEPEKQDDEESTKLNLNVKNSVYKRASCRSWRSGQKVTELTAAFNAHAGSASYYKQQTSLC